MDSIETRKVYVDEDNTAIVVCPHCGNTKTIDASKVKGRTTSVKMRCKCRTVFPVTFEFRRTRRKKTELSGYYSKLPDCETWFEMQVKNISQTGIGFETMTSHDLRQGHEIRVKFTLDDESKAGIEKNLLIVTLVKDTYVGCKFRDPAHFDTNLRFYLMP